MLLAPEQLCGSSIIVILFRASNASFFFFWSDNVFFLNNNKKYFVPCNCWWFYSISLYHAEAFLLHVRFFFNSCRISPVKTKCLTNQWRKKEFICDVFFIWPLPFFTPILFIHWEKEKKMWKTTERCSSLAAFIIWCTCYRAYNARVSTQCITQYVCVYVWRQQWAGPQKKWGKWYFAANVAFDCAGKRRADCIHFTRPIFDYIAFI